jgi:BlaI family penicillinase repressor
MAGANLDLFESEWAILQAVWKLQPCAAPTVQEALEKEKGWAYTTVKTMMDRMVKKGLLKVEKIRNLHLYSAVISRPEAQKSEIMKTLKRAFNGTITPMMQFLIENDELTEAEYRHVERLIKNRNRRKAGSKKKR